MSNTITIHAEAGSTIVVGSTLPGVSDVQVVEVPAPATDASGFRSSDKLRALFGAWSDAFGRGDDQHGRYLFTKAVLGDSIGDPSWSRNGEMTNDQADRLITVLGVVTSLT